MNKREVDWLQDALHTFNGGNWYGWKTHGDNGDKIPEYQQIDQAKLVPLLVASIIELEARVKTLEG